MFPNGNLWRPSISSSSFFRGQFRPGWDSVSVVTNAVQHQRHEGKRHCFCSVRDKRCSFVEFNFKRKCEVKFFSTQVKNFWDKILKVCAIQFSTQSKFILRKFQIPIFVCLHTQDFEKFVHNLIPQFKSRNLCVFTWVTNDVVTPAASHSPCHKDDHVHH